MRFAAFAILTTLATLNRETGLLLVVLYGLWHWPRLRERQTLFNVVFLMMVSISVTAVLHITRGPAPHVLGLSKTLDTNLLRLTTYSIVIIPQHLVFIPLWLLVLANHRASKTLRRLTWVIPLYGVMFLVGALWNEVRLLITILPVALAVGLAD